LVRSISARAGRGRRGSQTSDPSNQSETGLDGSGDNLAEFEGRFRFNFDSATHNVGNERCRRVVRIFRKINGPAWVRFYGLQTPIRPPPECRRGACFKGADVVIIRDNVVRHRPIRRKGESCARIKHMFTRRSQRLMHLLSPVPPEGFAHLPWQFAA
jgi:hypothetical protein